MKKEKTLNLMDNNIGENKSSSGIGATKILLFFLISTAVSACVALIVSRDLLDKNFLNAIPLSTGFIGILLIGRAISLWRQETTRILLLGLILATLVLETLRGYLPSLKLALNLTLVGLLALVLFILWKSPLPRLGASFVPGLARALGLAVLFGVLPQGGSYVILSIIFPGFVVANPDWSHAINPSVGVVFLLLSFSIGYLNCLIGEEAGWRGYLVRGMAGRYSRGKFIWLSSLLFALWHLPFDLMIAHADPLNLIVNQGVRMVTGASFAYFFVATVWSLIPVSLFHTLHNFVGYSIVNPTGPFIAKPNNIQGLLFVILFLIFTVAVLIIVRWLAIRKDEWSPPRVPNLIRDGIVPKETQKNNLQRVKNETISQNLCVCFN